MHVKEATKQKASKQHVMELQLPSVQFDPLDQIGTNDCCVEYGHTAHGSPVEFMLADDLVIAPTDSNAASVDVSKLEKKLRQSELRQLPKKCRLLPVLGNSKIFRSVIRREQPDVQSVRQLER